MYKLKEISDNEYSQSISLCVDALKCIKPEHIISNGIIPERNVVINLAYQIGMQDSINGNNNYIGCISGELKKRFDFDADLIGNTLKEEARRTTEGVYPDFLLHGSLTSRTPSEQIMIMEVKSCKQIKQTHFNWDMYKLCQYVNKLQFKDSIYLIIYQKEETVQEKRRIPSKEKIINNKIKKFDTKINKLQIMTI